MPLTQLSRGSQPRVVTDTLVVNEPQELEGGDTIQQLRIQYTTHGQISVNRDNVVWVCHALTANSDPKEWWPGLIGDDCLINPGEHFIVCANILGSCYGTTGPADNSETGQKIGLDFPEITIRDMVKAHELLRKHLDINSIRLGIGGSMGGQQLLEWAITSPDLFENLCVIATNARHSAWGIAFNTAQRMALESDPSFFTKEKTAGRKGLEAARAIAMLSYRNQHTYNSTQTDAGAVTKDYRAESYQRYQGQKLSQRFDAHSYYYLSKAMDSHHVGRGRGSTEKALALIKARTLVVGIQSDLLFPIEDQEFIASNITGARLEVIDSGYGHDGFLIEVEQLSALLRDFLG